MVGDEDRVGVAEATQSGHVDQARLMETLPSAYLYNAVLPYVVRAEVQDWVIYPSGDWFFNTVYQD